MTLVWAYLVVSLIVGVVAVRVLFWTADSALHVTLGDLLAFAVFVVIFGILWPCWLVAWFKDMAEQRLGQRRTFV